MVQGWNNSNYLFLVENKDESFEFTIKYKFNEFLPEFQFVGILNWDEFLVADSNSKHYVIPTIPLDVKYLTPIPDFDQEFNLIPDQKLFNLIRWHVMPVVFGGDPTSEENIKWIDLDQHVDVVIWWNEQYRYHKRFKVSQNFNEKQLFDAAYILADEIRLGKHSQPNWFKSLFTKNQHIQTLKSRCPGFTDEEYGKAIGKAMFETR
jgi:hypothetical protein